MSRRITRPDPSADAAVEPAPASPRERYNAALREVQAIDARLTDDQRRRFSAGVPPRDQLERDYADARKRKRDAFLDMLGDAR